MDIDLLSKMVKELILDNDRVVLPGLGSFVAEMVPSTFSDKGYTINPPYRRLYFRAKPDDGDILVRFYAESNNVDMHMAERIVRDFIKELKSLLHSRKTVVFPGLGRLRATKENNVFFVADEDLNIYPAGFGLEPISLKSHQETREEVIAAVEDLKSMLNVPVQPDPVSEPLPSEEPENMHESALDEPETVPVPEILPQPELAPTEDPLPVEVSVQVDEPELPQEVQVVKKNGWRIFKIAICVLVAIAVLLLIALAIVGRVNPELVDRYLYTPEELKILNHIL